MTTPTDLTPCPRCGALVPANPGGPTHAYLDASPGCWAIFGEVLARGYTDYGYAGVNDLAVDAYAVQHPGTPSQQTIQSANVHLISLYLMLEKGLDPRQAGRAKQRFTHNPDYVWLEPPPSLGTVNVLAMHRAHTAAEFTQAAWKWARAAWDAWAVHHEAVIYWAEKP